MAFDKEKPIKKPADELPGNRSVNGNKEAEKKKKAFEEGSRNDSTSLPPKEKILNEDNRIVNIEEQKKRGNKK